MRPKNFYFFCIFLLFSYLLKSQSCSYTFTENICFMNYLIDNNLTDDALTLLKNLNTQKTLTFSQSDSINYYIANIYYHKEQYDSAIYYYDKISLDNPFSLKSEFYLCNSYIKSDSILHAKENLLKISSSDTSIIELIQFQLSGIALLERNYHAFDNYAKKFTYQNPNLLVEEKNLMDCSLKIKQLKKKSPFIAGSLSTLVPGLGKVYAGKPKQGISAFLPIAILGLQAYEAYQKDGIKNARFIIFGSLFSVFYIGNIWGSALSVHVVNQEMNNEVNRQILFNLDIPLHRFFR